MAESRDLAELNLIYAQADSLAKGFPEAQFKTVAALFVIIGWLLTASSAQDFIRAHATVLLPATVIAMATLVCFKGIWIHGYYAKAQSLSPETVDVFHVGRAVPTTFFLVNVIVCSAVVCVVWLICV